MLAEEKTVSRLRPVVTVADEVLEYAARHGNVVTLQEAQAINKKLAAEHFLAWGTGFNANQLAVVDQTNPLEPPKIVLKRQPAEVGGHAKQFAKNVVDSYELAQKRIPIFVEVMKIRQEFVPLYLLNRPEIGEATAAVLETIRGQLSKAINLETEGLTDPRKFVEMEKKFTQDANDLITANFPGIDERDRNILTDTLVNDMLGLGDIDLLFADEMLEEFVINAAEQPTWLYHKKFGWVKTNIQIEDEEKTREMSEAIARRIGRSITNLKPLLDASLMSGDRVNATLWPVSSAGNTITIRRFARHPWTIVDLMRTHTADASIFAFIWLAMQYESNLIVVGGTGSGKTSYLNAILPFIPPNQRIVTIEDTRELQLPDFSHWVPMLTQPPNQEGEGGIDMLDLMVNSLRMRPDRIVLGEVRTHEAAQVLFEAIHTGHSVYSTFHSDTASAAYKRITEPPIAVPPSELESIHLFTTAFRDRRTGKRRISQIVEILPSAGIVGVELNLVYRHDPRNDSFEKVNQSSKIFDEVSAHTGMTVQEMEQDLTDKRHVLEWLLANNVNDVNKLGLVMANYYADKDYIINAALKKQSPNMVIKR